MPARPSARTTTRTAAILGGAGLLIAGCVAVPLLAGSDPARTPLVAPKPAAAKTAPAATMTTAAPEQADVKKPAAETTDWAALTDEQWKARLTPEQFNVLRKHGTERSGTGKYAYSKDEGVYDCAACGQPLFDADAKFESGTGWPSFYEPVDGVKGEKVGETVDRSWFMTRTEVHCGRCGGHLGHVFEDGPEPTGLRYCINSAALELDPKEKADAE